MKAVESGVCRYAELGPESMTMADGIGGMMAGMMGGVRASGQGMFGNGNVSANMMAGNI